MIPSPRHDPRRSRFKKHASLKDVFQSIGSYSQAALRIMLVVAIVAFVILIFATRKNDQIVMEPIHVPPGMEAKGYDGRIIALKILDKVSLLAKQTQTSKDFNEVGAFNSQNDVSLEMMGVGLSINSIVQYVESMFGVTHPTISGEIIEDDGKLLLTMRFSGSVPKSITVLRKSMNSYADEVEQVTLFAANEILRITDPYYIAIQNMDKGKLAQTIKICHELIATDHKDAPWAYNLLAAAYYLQGNFTESIQSIDEGVQKFPSFFRLNQNRYYSRVKIGEGDEAIKQLLSAFESSGKTAEDFNLFMGMLDEMDNRDMARPYLEEFGRRYPDSQDYLDHKINFLFQDQLKDSLVAYLAKLERLRPTTYRRQLQQAKTFYFYQQARPALDIADEMLKIDSTYQVLRLMGDIHFQSGDLMQAEKYYRLAFKKSMKSADEQNDLGRALRQLGKYNEAETLLLQAIAIDGNWKIPHLELSNLYSKQGRASEAHMQILLFYDKSDKGWQDARQVAEFYQEQNLPDSAISMYKQIIGKVLFDADLLNELAFTYEKQNQPDSAMKYVRKAVACGPNNPYALSTLAELYSLRNQPDSFNFFMRKAVRNGYDLSTVDFSLPAYNLMKDDKDFKAMLAKK